MSRRFGFTVLLLIVAICTPAQHCLGQASARKAPARQPISGMGMGMPGAATTEAVVRVYRVLDLVLPTPNYAFYSTILPTLSEKGSIGELGQFAPVPADNVMGMGLVGGYGGMMPGGGVPGIGGFGGMSGESGYGAGGLGGGMTGSMAGGEGAGMGQGAPQLPSGAILGGGRQITLPGLIQAIQAFIDPPSWSGMEGNGTIVALGNSLVVNQSPANHARLEDFLAQLRSQSGALQTVTVEACWLLLDSQQLQELTSGRENGFGPRDAEYFRGRVTCFNGQTVHVVSGRLQTVIQGAIPVVGGEAAGYQAQLLKPHIGAMLQVTPTVLPDGTAAIVDVRSIVTRADPPPPSIGLYDPFAKLSEPPSNAAPTVQVDRLNIAAQQLATTLRLPVGQPTLVGGLTFPGTEEGDESRQLYLVIEVTGEVERRPK